MADFDDITGWREEYRAFKQTKKYAALGGPLRGKGEPIPRWPSVKLNTTQAVALMTAILKHDELIDSFRQMGKWYHANPFNDGAFDRTGDGRPNRTPEPMPAFHDTDTFVRYFYLKMLPEIRPSTTAGVIQCVGQFLFDQDLKRLDDLNVAAFKCFMREFPYDFDFSDLDGA